MSLASLFTAVFGCAVCIVIGYFAVSRLWPPEISRSLIWVFAPAAGAGICSIIFMVFRRPMFTVEIALLVSFAAAWFFFRRPGMPPAASLQLLRLPVGWLLLACALGMAASQWMVRLERAPHGDWDATAIWNSHSRYLYRDGPAWQDHILNTFHPDYPLLVPSLVARLWRYTGSDIPDAAGVLAIMFSLSVVAVLVGVLVEIRGVSIAVLAALVLLGTPFYLEYSVSESADVPLSLFILSTVALIFLQSRRAPDRPGLLVLAGFMAGCAAWVKNEGLLFVAVTSMVLLLPVVARPAKTLRRFGAFGAGLLLPLLVVAWFKLTIAPPNDVMGSRQYAEIIEKIVNPDRYVTVLQNFWSVFWSFGNFLVNPVVLLLVYIGLCGIDRVTLRNPGWLQGVSVCALVLAGYYAIYIVTPLDLQWHIDTSLPRLYLQVWPTFLLLAGSVIQPAAATET